MLELILYAVFGKHETLTFNKLHANTIFYIFVLVVEMFPKLHI